MLRAFLHQSVHCDASESERQCSFFGRFLLSCFTALPYLSHAPSIAHLSTGGQDRMSNTIDVELLLEQLPAGVVFYHQNDPDLEHLDYIWGLDMKERVYGKVLELLLQGVQDQGGRGGGGEGARLRGHEAS